MDSNLDTTSLAKEKVFFFKKTPPPPLKAIAHFLPLVLLSEHDESSVEYNERVAIHDDHIPSSNCKVTCKATKTCI
jgi:hypothetical protein